MIWFLGIFTIISQTLILREFSQVFQSNEIVIGILIFSWLTGSGLGSSIFRYLPDKIKYNKRFIPSSIVFMAFLLFLQMILSRLLFSFYQYKSLPNIFLLVLLSFLIILPLSFLAGVVFTDLASDVKHKSISYVYLVESFAAFIGGIIFSFILAGRIENLTISIIFIMISIFLYFIYFSAALKKTRTFVFALLFIFFIPFFVPNILMLSRSLQWKNNEILIYSKDSRNGNVTLVRNGNLNSLYLNGKVLFHYPDMSLYEEGSILPPLINNHAENLLILGFAPIDFIYNLMKFFPKKITIVLADEVLANILSDQISEIIPKGNLTIDIIISDPYLWAGQTSNSFDIVYLKISLPTTISENRFFSQSFYKKISKIIEESGIVTFFVPFEENNPSIHTIKNLQIIYNTLNSVFDVVKFIPAGSFHFFASKKNFEINQTLIENNIKKFKLTLQNFNSSLLSHYLSDQRMAAYNKLILTSDNTTINTLFSSQIYSNNLQMWLDKNLASSWIFLIIFFVTVLILFFKNAHRLKNIFIPDRTSFLIFFLSFCSMVGEVILLNFYQSLSGQLYHHYCFLVSLFMLGISTGSGLFYMKKNLCSLYKFLPLSVVLFLLTIEFLHTQVFFLNHLLISIFTFVLNFIGGFFLGGIFVSFAKNKQGFVTSSEVVVAKIYSFDLFGSALGALLTGSILIPVFGRSYILYTFAALLLIFSLFYNWSKK